VNHPHLVEKSSHHSEEVKENDIRVYQISDSFTSENVNGEYDIESRRVSVVSETPVLKLHNNFKSEKVELSKRQFSKMDEMNDSNHDLLVPQAPKLKLSNFKSMKVK